MHWAAWGGGKPGHISVLPEYVCETTATGKATAKPHTFRRFFYPYKILYLAGLEPVRKKYVAQ